MSLNPIASTIIVVMYFVFMALAVGAFVMMAFALKVLNTKLEEVLVKVDPAFSKVDHILAVVDEKVSTIGSKAEGILSQGEDVAETVHDKVDKTAVTVQRSIQAPLIGINSLAAGLSQGVKTFGKLAAQHKADERAPIAVTMAPTAGLPAITENDYTTPSQDKVTESIRVGRR